MLRPLLSLLLAVAGAALPLSKKPSQLVTLRPSGPGGGTLELSSVVGAGAELCGSHSSGLSSVTPLGGFVEGYLTKAK